jgi:hypothetical protein
VERRRLGWMAEASTIDRVWRKVLITFQSAPRQKSERYHAPP